jgi:hypothetical protein
MNKYLNGIFSAPSRGVSYIFPVIYRCRPGQHKREKTKSFSLFFIFKSGGTCRPAPSCNIFYKSPARQTSSAELVVLEWRCVTRIASQFLSFSFSPQPNVIATDFLF